MAGAGALSVALASVPPMPSTTPVRRTPVQHTFAELGTPLSDVTFVVVDLETTGGRVTDSGITEIGAVKVRGGEVLGEIQSLIDPGRPVPAFVCEKNLIMIVRI